MSTAESTKKLHRERILRGQCPLCGQEAAPYRLCHDHRQRLRLDRSLKRGAKTGVVKSLGEGRERKWFLGDKVDDSAANAEWEKWSTPFYLPETDRRGRPRLRDIPVDVEATLLAVIRFINRPCTTEEILAAWGKLRDRRSSPLSHDLGRIIKAADKRARRLAKNLEIAQRTSPPSGARKGVSGSKTSSPGRE